MKTSPDELVHSQIIQLGIDHILVWNGYYTLVKCSNSCRSKSNFFNDACIPVNRNNIAIGKWFIEKNSKRTQKIFETFDAIDRYSLYPIQLQAQQY